MACPAGTSAQAMVRGAGIALLGAAAIVMAAGTVHGSRPVRFGTATGQQRNDPVRRQNHRPDGGNRKRTCSHPHIRASVTRQRDVRYDHDHSHHQGHQKEMCTQHTDD